MVICWVGMMFTVRPLLHTTAGLLQSSTGTVYSQTLFSPRLSSKIHLILCSAAWGNSGSIKTPGAAVVFQAELAADSDAVTAVRIDLAVLRSMEGDAAGAEVEFRGLLGEERARAAGVRTMREIDMLNNLGAVLRQMGKGDESLAVQREALTARETLHGAGSLQAAESHNNIASALFVKGDFDGAIGEFRTAIALREKLLRPDHPLIVRAKSNVGLALVRAGRPAEGAVPLREAYESWNGAFGHLHAGRVAAGTSLAEAHRRMSEFDASVTLLREVLSWQREHTPNEAKHWVIEDLFPREMRGLRKKSPDAMIWGRRKKVIEWGGEYSTRKLEALFSFIRHRNYAFEIW